MARMNQNVLLVFCLRIADGIANGIWNLSVLSTYISVLEGSTPAGNAKVGYVQAIQGTALASAAIPAGWLASKYRRDLILKCAGGVELVAIGMTSAAILAATHKYMLLCIAVAWWGVAQGYSPVLDALFADSVPTGARSNIYTTQFICSILSQGLGPAIAALLFWIHGNTWDIEVLQKVMLVGMCMAVIPACMLFFFDDRKALGAESEGLLRASGRAALEQAGGVRRRRSRTRRRANGSKPDSLGSSSGSDELRQPLLESVVVEHEGQEGQQDGERGLGVQQGRKEEQQDEGVLIRAVADGVTGQQQGQQAVEQQQHLVQQQQQQQEHGRESHALMLNSTGTTRVSTDVPSAQRHIGSTAPTAHALAAAVAAAAEQQQQQQEQEQEQEQDQQQQQREDPPVKPAGHWGYLNASWIPFILATSDIIIGLASGMTIKFFPIFFKDEVALKPLYVNLLYCCVPVGLSLCSFVCQRVSRVIGRVQAMTLFKAVGISLLYVMASLKDIWTVPHIIIPIYLTRTCIMNATYPLQKSIMMDYVPKRSRAKWSSFEAVTSFGWSGSAALGGWLIQHYGFGMNFYITATMQLAAWSVLLLLMPLVPRQEGGVASAAGSVAASRDVSVTGGEAGEAAAVQNDEGAAGGGMGSNDRAAATV